MRQTKRGWIVALALLLLIGVLAFALALCFSDINGFSAVDYETREHLITEEFSDISIETDTSDIVFLKAEDGKCRVVSYEAENMKNSVSVSDGTLTVKCNDTRRWYEYIGISLKEPKISVYLPSGEYSSLKIKESTGDVEIPSDFKFEDIDVSVSTGDVKCLASAERDIKISASTGDIDVGGVSASSIDLEVSTGRIIGFNISCSGDLRIDVSTGKTRLTSVGCKNLISSGDTGDIYLTNVIATEKFSIERSTGDVNFDGCDAAEIFVETDTGDVEGSLLSGKTFTVNTDTGKKNVPESTSGGKCEIPTDTGDIKITVK